MLKQRIIDPDLAKAIQATGQPWLLSQLFAARGLHPDDLSTGLLTGDGMKGLPEAVARLRAAILSKEQICIVADYDSDGATACTVMFRGLKSLGANVSYFVPSRHAHGYGLSPMVADIVADSTPAPTLLVTVDNGIASIEGVARAKERGMDVVVTDHHLPAVSGVLPDCAALVNPNQPGCLFGSKAAAGCGVAWYVIKALFESDIPDTNVDVSFHPDDLLPYVAFGTVADVVPLDVNNRLLVAAGLAILSRNPGLYPGLSALCAELGKDVTDVTTTDIGFTLAPRINAAGRLADMRVGIQLLTTQSTSEAENLARELNSLNETRKTLSDEMTRDAEAKVAVLPDPSPMGLVITGDSYHEGVVGIIASRIKEQVHRPVFVFSTADEHGICKGSGRSIPGVHLRDVLDWVSKQAPDIFVRFGGHAMAAGAAIRSANVAAFTDWFDQGVRALASDPSVFDKEIWTDGGLPGWLRNERTVSLIHSTVWGQTFPPPLFMDEFEVVDQKLIGSNSAHLRLDLADEWGEYTAIWFNHADPLPQKIRCAYQLRVNEWRNKRQIQLQITHAEAA